MGILARSLKI